MPTAKVEAKTTRVDCPNCAKTAEAEIRKLTGINEACVDLLNCKVTYSFDSAATSDEKLRAEIERLGHFRFVEDNAESRRALPFSRSLLWSVVIAIGLTVTGLLVKFGVGSHQAGDILIYFAIAAGGWDIVRRAFASLRNLRLDMNALMAIAIAGAIAIGDLHEALAVVILFDLANLLESFSLWKLSRNLTDLQEFTSNVALLKKEGKTLEVSPESLRIGDTAVVKEGMRIPVDGKIATGTSFLDMSSLTGETQPVSVAAGDDVYAGALNQDGYLEIKVTSPVSESRIGQIMKLVEDASARKANVERTVDRFAKVYTPVVVSLAALLAVVPPLAFGAGFAEWFYKALVFLVISCPCALVIATPVAVTTALAAASRLKAIVKGGDVLERLSRARKVAFDKTGTLTTGRMQLSEIKLHNQQERTEALAVAAGLESVSNHPIAAAVSEAARRENVMPTPITGHKAIPGVGVAGKVNGSNYEFGGVEILSDRSKILDTTGAVAFLTRNKQLEATFSFADEIRPEAGETIAKLRKLKMSPIGVISGDRRDNVEKLGEGLKLDFAYGEQLPEDKFGVISELGDSVAMIGDGINDVVALSGSDLSISIGRFGSDIPARHSDIVLFGDSIAELPRLFKLGRRSLAMIRANIAFALALKALFLILAAVGYANIWMAVVADMGASLAVIFNSLRLLRA